MELYLKRDTFTDTSTTGVLSIDGQFECYILEDKCRDLHDHMDTTEIEGKKVYGKTAIPYGRYEVDFTMSNRFKVMMPLLLNTKGFKGIRIHSGNTEVDSLGCLLCGKKRANDTITESKSATNLLYSKIQSAKMHKEKIFITITK